MLFEIINKLYAYSKINIFHTQYFATKSEISAIYQYIMYVNLTIYFLYHNHYIVRRRLIAILKFGIVRTRNDIAASGKMYDKLYKSEYTYIF